MFGLTIDKLMIIAVIAVFVIGPERLPLYAAKLASLVRTLRSLADTAKTRVGEELGPEFTETEWKKLDPRQYDPRRIIREALLDEDPPAITPAIVAPPVAPAPRNEHSMQRLLGLSRTAQPRALTLTDLTGASSTGTVTGQPTSETVEPESAVSPAPAETAEPALTPR